VNRNSLTHKTLLLIRVPFVPDTFFFLNLHGRYPVISDVPAAPVAAFIVGFAVYFACAKIGLIAPVISMPNRADVS
jgi:hypothetical protein